MFAAPARFVGILAACLVGHVTLAAENPAVEPYVRASEAPDGSVALEVCSRRFVPASGTGPAVHLVAAVHIADRQFYEAMQTRLDRSDVVLFEGVKPAGAGAFAAGLDDAAKVTATRRRMQFLQLVIAHHREERSELPADLHAMTAEDAARYRSVIESSLTDAWDRPFEYSIEAAPAPEDGVSPGEFARLRSAGADIASADDDIVVDGPPALKRKPSAKAAGGNIQAQLAKMLDVTFQLDEIDSSKPRWRNSDMTIDEVRERLEQAGPGAAAILAILDGSSLQVKLAAILIGFISQSKSMSGIVKLAVVDMLAHSADALADHMPGGKATVKVLIDDRNAVVLADLEHIVANEPAVKDIAIFYGAGHMKAFEESLVASGYTPTESDWTAAMRADPKDAGLSPAQTKSMRSMLRSMMAPPRRTRQ
ncbi:MAG: hypothetical protein SGJ11_08165 [Phycisphaerae bacterium]|nr:hypothetical protein [Phycisphaerae bacterium]